MSFHRKQGLTFVLGIVFALGTAVPSAKAWDPFRSESRDVKRGNEHLQKGQHAEAVEAYETAATKLPKEAGVQLNRGLALLASDKPDAAREAFKLATQGNASKEVRAEAYYDLGLTFLKQADVAAKADKLEEAQGQLREAVDAFKSSLRSGPKNRDAAWNLELAKRRLVEVEKKQEEKKQQEEEKKKQEEEQKKQDEQQQNPDENKDQEKDDQDPQEKDGDKPKEESDKPKEEAQGKDGESKPNEPPKPDDKAAQPEPTPDEPKPQDAQPSEQQALPKPMQQALDSLANGEENLEKLRARMRAARQPRRVQKDW